MPAYMITARGAVPEFVAQAFDDAAAAAMGQFPESSVEDAKRIAGLAMVTGGHLRAISLMRERVDSLALEQPSLAGADLLEAVLVEKCVECGMHPPARFDGACADVRARPADSRAPIRTERSGP